MSLKVILVGDSGAGKTTLLMKFLGDSSLIGIPSTTSPLFFHREIPVDNTFVSAEIWDTAGQEKYRSLMSIYYRGASVALLCSPEADHSSVEEWVEAVKSVTPTCKIIPVLTKSDLLSKDEVIGLLDTFQNFLREFGLETPIVTSTVSGEGIIEVFTEAARCGIKVNSSFAKPLQKANDGGCC